MEQLRRRAPGSNLYACNTTDASHIALNAGATYDADLWRVVTAAQCRLSFLAGKSAIFPTMDLITVFIAEANVLLRQRLSKCLAQQADLQLVGTPRMLARC